MTKRITVFVYGVVSYAIFFVTFLYAIGFIGNVLVPKSIDSEPTSSLAWALFMDALLLGAFAVQHSAMARPTFKRWWTKVVPKPAERSTYVLFSSLILIALFAHWQPIGGSVWNVENPIGRGILYSAFAFGWVLILVATFLIDHFDLFGLRQVWLYVRGKDYTPVGFGTPWLYRYVRHPLYVGWFFAFWATPTMTVAHLVFAALATAYILVAIRFEERNLREEHPQYTEYRKRVPMLIPRLFGRSRPSVPQTA
jgi:protein-S-isoprenylcysteine O-methyltransferase Ste14